MELAKQQAKKKNDGNTKIQKGSKCADCKKLIGKKTFVQCINCKKCNLEECMKALKSINKNRLLLYTSGSEKYFCDECIKMLDVESLEIDNKQLLPITYVETNNKDDQEANESNQNEHNDLRIGVQELEKENNLLKTVSQKINNRVNEEAKKG